MLTFSSIGEYGRLGNQMFQIASTIGMAMNTDQLFRFNRVPMCFNALITYMGDLPALERYEIPWGYHDLTIYNKDLHGYLQSEKYFKHCEKYIKWLFLFDSYPPKPFNEFIAVHIRRGDYDNKHHVLLDRAYYENALNQLPNIPIIVFTDDIKEAMNVLPNCDRYLSGCPMYDMALMTLADYHVIANSSFSWWGSWLADSKKIIAPSKWFGPALWHIFTPDDIYTEKMQII